MNHDARAEKGPRRAEKRHIFLLIKSALRVTKYFLTNDALNLCETNTANGLSSTAVKR